MSPYYSNGKPVASPDWSPAKKRTHSRPLHYQWDMVDPSARGSCVNFHAFFVGKGIANVCLNALIFILVSIYYLPYPLVSGSLIKQPIPLLWRLRVTLKQQIILMSLFTLAGL